MESDINMEIIQSAHNPKLKNWISLKTKKGRDTQGLFLIEGIKLLEEAISSGQEIQSIIVDELKEIPFKIEDAINALPNKISIYKLSSHLMDKLSDTESPQGFFAVVKKQVNNLQHLIDNGTSFVLLLDQIQDPGNLGTMIRSADAAGVDAVILGNGTVELYNPKVIRSTMGSLFHIPILDLDIDEGIHMLKKVNFKILGTSPHAKESYFDVNLRENVAIIVGNESKGLSEEREQQVDQMVSIPMLGKAESLNVAMATTLILFEHVRQVEVK